MSAPARSRGKAWAIGSCGASLLYYASRFDRRWIPHDEGLTGQSADRILRGQMPHRDFDAMYTGLLEYLHAGAMSVVGVDLLTPRLVMLVAVAAWLPAVWAIAYRLVRSHSGAAFLTVLALLVGPPNYPASLPSWYNLFFATWATLALLRWTEDDTPRWLVIAGSLAGLSTLFKISGLYLLAGALFFTLNAETLDAVHRDRRTAPPVPWALGVSVITLVVGLVGIELALVRSQTGVATFVNYVLPSVCLGAVLVWTVFRGVDAATLVRRGARSWVLLAVGYALPVVPFIVWFGAAGALDDLVRGVFVLPQLRFSSVAASVPPLSRTWGAPALASLMFLVAVAPRWFGWCVGAVTLVGGTALLTRLEPGIYASIFNSFSLAVPVLALAGSALHAKELRRAEPSDPALLCVLWILALTHLVRFPLAAPVYLLYVTPLVALTAGGLLARVGSSPDLEPITTDEPEGARPPRPRRSLTVTLRRPAAVALGVFYAGYFAVGPNRGGLFGPLPPSGEVLLGVERGGIMVPVFEGIMYGQLVEFLQETSRSPYIYAGPDAPEVYFLSGLQNPTRTLYDLFAGPTDDAPALMANLSERAVNVVVLNTRPRFSDLPPDLRDALLAAYPLERTIGKFVVRWRRPDGL